VQRTNPGRPQIKLAAKVSGPGQWVTCDKFIVLPGDLKPKEE